MNFQQLRILREAVRQDFNLTAVADALFTSQPGVSKHIRDLEEELGIEIFVRHGKRLMGLTPPGKELLTVVERMLLDAGNVRKIAEQFSKQDEGELIVAATHTQARYALPKVVQAFRAACPKVHLVLHQGSPREIAEMVLHGEADLGIATEALENAPGLINFPCYVWHHTVLVPTGHPLTNNKVLTIDALSGYPIVTYHAGFTGRGHIDAAFAGAGVKPDVVLSAIDADVIKTYVELGLGVGIVAAMACDDKRDTGLVTLPAEHLFAPNVTRLAIRRGNYLRSFAYRFIELLVPALDEASVRKAIEPGANAAAETAD
jgi:LysR family transcriptional regulator, cys regulon transcriptional activator